MEFSQRGVKLLENLEGFKPFPYLDQAGYWTVGYGTRIAQNHDGTFTVPHVTEPEAEVLLVNHCKYTIYCLNKYVTAPLTQNQFDALVIFVYNIGENPFVESTMLRLLNDKQYTMAAAEFDKWIYEHKIPSDGLKHRRAAEKQLFLEP